MEFSSFSGSFVFIHKKARAEFCTGVRNPEDDAQWEACLKDLESLGYHENWIAPAQLSWDMGRQ